MIRISCDHCGKRLRVDDALVGRRVRCPSCKTPAIISLPKSAEEEYFPSWLGALCIGAGLFVVFLPASLWIGWGRSLVLATLAATFVVAIWQRKPILKWIKKDGSISPAPTRESVNFAKSSAPSENLVRANASPETFDSASDSAVPTEKLEDGSALPPRRKTVLVGFPIPRSTSQSLASTKAEEFAATDDLVTIRVPLHASSVNRPSQGKSLESVFGWLRGPSVTDVRFYSAGTVLHVCGSAIETPLVYHVEGMLREPYDASLIESGLPVAKRDHGIDGELPYWPTYRGATPEQRLRYLTWLNNGRCQPNIEIGYVFIYFYGLERRVLVDGCDHQVVLREVLRLLPIYRSNNSFRRYASNFIWTIVVMGANRITLSTDVLSQVIQETSYWNEENLSALLSNYCTQGIPLPKELAFLVAEHDQRTPRSVVVRRHPERFRELFEHRYSEQFAGGLVLREAKKPRRFLYSPASSSLGYEYVGGPSSHLTLPNVLGLPSQFKPLVEIWASVIEDLKKFDRAHRKAAGQVMTAAMYESLPVELRCEDHPDYDAWYTTLSRHIDDAGWALVPIGELAAIRGIPTRARLTKTQGEDLLKSADAMDMSIEPDARMTRQTYRWDEIVSVFPQEYRLEPDDKTYHAASILLRLGMTVAAADGTVDEIEISAIRSHLEQRFDLTPQASVRLEHLSQVLSRNPSDDSRIGKQIQHFPLEQRKVIGEFLVAVAAADETITAEELKTLRKTYRNLGLDPAMLEKIASGRVFASEDANNETDELVLDPNRIRQILADTEKVADLLQSVMLTDDDEGEECQFGVADIEAESNPSPMMTSPQHVSSTPPTASAVPRMVADGRIRPVSHALFDGLPERYHMFLQDLVTREEWTTSEFESLARQHRLMPRGAAESVNEWSSEKFGDLLVDDSGVQVIVQRSLLQIN
ncbi:MAG: TerB N-terminal domain-containing protein [Planctomycetaceae bacterium]